MSNPKIKVPVTIELRAGDVLVAVSENVGLWSAVLGEMLKELPQDRIVPCTGGGE